MGMTQAERLIKSLCEGAERRVHDAERTADEAAKRPTPLNKTSKVVRNAVDVLQAQNAAVKRARTTIREAGFEPPDPNETSMPITELAPCYSCTRKVTEASAVRKREQLRAIASLRNDAQIKVMGQPPAVVRKTLTALQAALAKV